MENLTPEQEKTLLEKMKELDYKQVLIQKLYNGAKGAVCFQTAPDFTT